MAKYAVTAKCGHTATIQIFAPTRERERQIAWDAPTPAKCERCIQAESASIQQ